MRVGIAVVFVGIIAVIVGIVRFATGGFVDGMITVGAGLVVTAIGCLSTVLMLLLFGKFVPWLLRAVSNLFHRGRKKRKEAGACE